jgi:excisionase family DNA binding protein
MTDQETALNPDPFFSEGHELKTPLFYTEKLDNEYFLTKGELADRCKVSPRTIDNWIIQKKIPVIKIGRVLRYDRNDVVKALEGYKVKAISL